MKSLKIIVTITDEETLKDYGEYNDDIIIDDFKDYPTLILDKCAEIKIIRED